MTFKAETDFEKTIRKRVNYRGDHMYFMHIFDTNGFIKEIMLEQTTDEHDHAETVSGLEFVAKLVNYAMEHGTVEDVVALARKCSLGRKTLPGIVYSELEQYAGGDK